MKLLSSPWGRKTGSPPVLRFYLKNLCWSHIFLYWKEIGPPLTLLVSNKRGLWPETGLSRPFTWVFECFSSQSLVKKILSILLDEVCSLKFDQVWWKLSKERSTNENWDIHSWKSSIWHLSLNCHFYHKNKGFHWNHPLCTTDLQSCYQVIEFYPKIIF